MDSRMYFYVIMVLFYAIEVFQKHFWRLETQILPQHQGSTRWVVNGNFLNYLSKLGAGVAFMLLVSFLNYLEEVVNDTQRPLPRRESPTVRLKDSLASDTSKDNCICNLLSCYIYFPRMRLASVLSFYVQIRISGNLYRWESTLQNSFKSLSVTKIKFNNPVI